MYFMSSVNGKNDLCQNQKALGYKSRWRYNQFLVGQLYIRPLALLKSLSAAHARASFRCS